MSEGPGKRLRACRQHAKLSAKELGQKASVLMGRGRPISESAVRNQENGTNGLPLEVAIAYGEVLGVDAGYLLFGNSDERVGKTPDYEDMFVNLSGTVTAHWAPPGVEGSGASDEVPFISMPGFEHVSRNGYTVSDASLEPVYGRGTLLVTCEWTEIGVVSGDHVLVVGFKEGSLVHRLMQVHKRGRSLVLEGLGSAAASIIHLTDGDEVQEAAMIDQVVVASLAIRERRLPPLKIPALALTERTEES